MHPLASIHIKPGTKHATMHKMQLPIVSHNAVIELKPCNKSHCKVVRTAMRNMHVARTPRYNATRYETTRRDATLCDIGPNAATSRLPTGNAPWPATGDRQGTHGKRVSPGNENSFGQQQSALVGTTGRISGPQIPLTIGARQA